MTEKFWLCSGFSHLPTRDGYICSRENADCEMPEDIYDWLEELGSENYEIIDEYEWDGSETECALFLKLHPDYEIAFKLMWPEHG